MPSQSVRVPDSRHRRAVLVFLFLLLGFAAVSANTPLASTQEPGSGWASVDVTVAGGIDASTYNSGSFVVRNEWDSDADITSVTFDLRDGLVTDAVFDPDGTAGDPVGKGFTPDSGSGDTGLDAHTFGSPNGGGYDTLTIDFTDFEPGEQLGFSVDIDPTSIKDASDPGPSHSGSVSGLELTGSTVTVTFGGGEEVAGQIFASDSGESGGEVDLRADLVDVPALAVDAGSPATVGDEEVTIQVTGPADATVEILHTETALYLDGVPNGGFDIDPYERNSVIDIERSSVTLDGSGEADVPLTLVKSEDEGGINQVTARIPDGDGLHRETSNTLVLVLDPEAVGTPDALEASASSIDFGDVDPGASATGNVTFTNLGVDGDPVITISEATLGGGDAGEFSHDLATPVDVQPGGSVAVEVTHTASETTGAKSAVLTLTHSGEDSPVEVALEANTTTDIEPTPDDPDDPDDPEDPEPGVGSVLYRVNAGGGSINGTPDWSPDSGSSSSPYVNTGSTFGTSDSVDMSDPSVPPGTPEEIFQSERYDPPGGSEMQWDFPVDDGTYQVSLFFAEIYSGVHFSGGRVFDVTIDGELVLDDYDTYADAGADAAVVKTFTTTVEDGNIDIDFDRVTENPTVKGIQIAQLGGQPGVLGVSPTDINYGETLPNSTSTESVSFHNLGIEDDPAITITSATISGPDASEFSHDLGIPVSIEPGGSVAASVVHTSTIDNGPKSATLTIEHDGDNTPIEVNLSAEVVSDIPVGFGKSTVSGANANDVTSLQFGPDGRMYASSQDGTLYAFTVIREGPNDYTATGTEILTDVKDLPNHDDDGELNTSHDDRLITGLTVVGTATNPVIYVASSDPRIGAGPSGSDLNLDTNSGVLSRLTWTGFEWEHVQLVRGLPRSEENHTANGLVLDEATNTLYIAQGGNTNHGGPSNNFALLPEFALSAAILSVDLDAIGDSTYDLPTLDDEDRPGSDDANDPFGGNDGKNQAILVSGGPVQVYAPGFRNPYDVVITESGRMYTVDNGGNAAWGAPPINEGPSGVCTNGVSEPGETMSDTLHLITGAGYYGGHPNPTRGNIANTFNPSNPQSPVPSANPVECDYLSLAQRGVLESFPSSTNGLVEYTADNFGGALKGDLFTASFNNTVYHLAIDQATGLVSNEDQLFTSVGQVPLDVTAAGPADPFPGTIWVGDYGADKLVVFEPNDYDGGSGPVCTGAYDDTIDEDGDGFSNADEVDNGTNPCSAGSQPGDWDGDFVSDLNDPDDDNDGIPDELDSFALDPENGAGTNLPVLYTWENDAPPAGGLLDLGFTGLMTNDVTNYRYQFDPANMTAGGAAGVTTIDEIANGTAAGATNSQEYGFQFGFVAPAETFQARTRVVQPFSSIEPQAGQELGLMVGLGDQDNYVQVVVAGASGGAIQVDTEFAGQNQTVATDAQDLSGIAIVDLYFEIDPIAGTGQARYALNDGSGFGAVANLGPAIDLPAEWLSAEVLAMGIISTSSGPAPAFPGTWDFVEVDFSGPSNPELGVSPQSVDFGDVPAGESASESVTYTNLGEPGDDTITISEATIGGDDAAEFDHDLVLPQDLEPGDSVSVNISHTASETEGAKSATFALVHSGENSPVEIGLAANTPGTAEPGDGWASVDITVTGGIDASTYNGGSFVVRNEPGSEDDIASITFDLRDGLVTDAVFDPDGTAGDPVGKGFTADSGAGDTGLDGHQFGSPNGGGYDTLIIDFTDFQPGETLSFSVDIDPTSIKDAPQPGPSESGSVSGLELTGSSVIVTYASGAIVSGQVFASDSGESGGEVDLRADLTDQPSLSVSAGSPATVEDAEVIIDVSGPAGATVELLHTESALFLDGVPNGGFDIEPYERNTVIDIQRSSVTLDGSGAAAVPFTLVKSIDEGGINQVTARIPDGDGLHRQTSETLVLVLDPALPGTANILEASTGSLGFGDVVAGETVTGDITYTNIGADGDPVITVSDVAISGTDAAEFSHDLAAPVDIAPGDSVTVEVTHTASETAGAKAASLSVTHTGEDSSLETSLSANTVVDSEPEPGSVIYRVNAGGDLEAGTPEWTADDGTYVNTGSTYSSSTNIDMTDPSVPADTPSAIFQSERYDLAGGSAMQWDFPVDDGIYQVDLFFAEIYNGAHFSGGRVFDVTIDGELVLDNYDTYADVGADTAVVKSFDTTVADGVIDIDFDHVTENPSIKGIQVIRLAGQPNTLGASTDSLDFGTLDPGDTVTRSVTYKNLGEDGDPSILISDAMISGSDAAEFSTDMSVSAVLEPGDSLAIQVSHTASETAGPKDATLTLTHSGDNSPTQAALQATTATVAAPGTVVYRVNAGGNAVDGNPEWSADSGGSSSPYVNTGSTYGSSASINISDPSVPAGTAEEIFQSERYDTASGSEMQWDFPVANGTYQVDLYFAEIYNGAYFSGGRVFDVTIDGILVLDDYDTYADVGPSTGVVKTFTTTVDDGNIDIDFDRIAENPSIKGVQVSLVEE